MKRPTTKKPMDKRRRKAILDAIPPGTQTHQMNELQKQALREKIDEIRKKGARRTNPPKK